ncbi:MAG: substrate-binding domain-containing protein [Chthoniobacterales bacterium]
MAGIICLPGSSADIRTLRVHKVPIVNISSSLESPRLPSVIADNELAGRMVAEHLIRCRFHHFAFYGCSNLHSHILRRKGFREVIEAAGYSCSALLQRRVAYMSRISATQKLALRKWLAGLPRPTGICCGLDSDAWEILSGCNALGLKVGTEVGIVGYGNDEFYCTTRKPFISSVENRPDRIGYEAATLLLRLMRGGNPPTAPIMIPPEGVVQRESASIFLVEDRHVKMAIQFIREHLHEPLLPLLQQLFKCIPMSRRTLERRFQQCLSQSIVEVIQSLKVEKIKQLLDTSPMKLHEIAHVCGIASPPYLTKLFRDKMGITPIKYRMRFQYRHADALSKKIAGK